MDTRQLAAFCEVVERQSFSQAAERLGVTQPAVSLQVRSLERRLGTQLLDRSGRKVLPTEAGLHLYRSAQRLLALEEQLLEDLAGIEERELGGTFEVGASTGPGGSVVATLLCEFQQQNPALHVALSVFDTQRVVEMVAERQLELGVVGAAPRRRGVVFEPFLRDEVVLVCPAHHRFANRTVTLNELREETLIVMQDGAGVRQVIEDELRARGIRLRDLDVRLELGLQESVKTAVQRGFGVTFISRSSIEPEVQNGSLAIAHVDGFEASREISLVRAGGRSTTRAAQAFIDFARERLGVETLVAG
jgi:DNA-binding transcriptional LysR family regulator